MSLPGPDQTVTVGPNQSVISSLATKVIELAHSIKHQTEPTRRDSGIAADATVLLVNILRRAEQDF